MTISKYDIYSNIKCFEIFFRIKSFKIHFYEYMKIIQLVLNCMIHFSSLYIPYKTLSDNTFYICDWSQSVLSHPIFANNEFERASKRNCLKLN